MSLQGFLAHRGKAVEFVHTAAGTHDPATETHGAPVVTKVKGQAMRVAGDPERYKALELIESESPTLLFTPKTRGELPAMDSVVEWGDVGFSVKDIEPLALNGTATAARIVVSR